MENPEVNRLYKYCSFQEYALKNLEKNIVFYSPPISFNDPFDCTFQAIYEFESRSKLIEATIPVFSIALGMSANEARARLQSVHTFSDEDITRLINRLKEGFIKKQLYEIGVYCISEVKDSILMWSHYANHHNGFCIEFKREIGGFFENIGKVIYKDEYFKYNFFENTEEIGKRDEELFLTKGKCWEYEAEWRYISEANSYSNYPDDAIIGIIFGLKMKNENKLIIKDILRYKPHIKYYDAKMSEEKFEIKIVPE